MVENKPGGSGVVGEVLLERNDEDFSEQPDWIADMQLTRVELGGRPYPP